MKFAILGEKGQVVRVLECDDADERAMLPLMKAMDLGSVVPVDDAEKAPDLGDTWDGKVFGASAEKIEERVCEVTCSEKTRETRVLTTEEKRARR